MPFKNRQIISRRSANQNQLGKMHPSAERLDGLQETCIAYLKNLAPGLDRFGSNMG